MSITPPEGWPRISSALFYDDAPAAIEWLEKAFGLETRLRVEDGAGAEPTSNDHGEHEDRTYAAEDCEGHHWWFGQRLRSGPRGGA